MQQLPDALAPLAAYRQFLCYRLAPHPDKPGKTLKRPINPVTGYDCGVDDAPAYVDAVAACNAATRWGAGYGVAFVLTERDPFFFLDIDGCRTPTGWSQLATDLCSEFAGVAVEVSQSGNGLHLIGTGKAPDHGKRNDAMGLEFYTERRFIALTGIHAVGSAATDRSSQLPGLVQRYFAPKAATTGAEWTTGPCEGWSGPTDDAQLIEWAMRSTSAGTAFGGRASFADLWNADVTALARTYPDPTGASAYNASSADAALAAHLAFWTGKDCERIERLMRMSALARPKWDDRTDYYLRDRTILGAVALSRDVLTAKQPEPPPTPQVPAELAAPGDDGPAFTPFKGSTFLALDDQPKIFKGCVYILDMHRVLVPGGRLLRPEQFRAMFGGYMSAMDATNERHSRNAWEAFTESQGFRCPRADTVTFKPDRPPAELISDAGRISANTWWPVAVPRAVGDPSPFLNHLRKVLPDQRDQTILLSYMAACVQHKGTKFQWAPLIQGVEGNGKTLFSRCVAEALGRRYTHWPKASKLTKDFNGWMQGTLLILVEDIYVEDSRREILEQLKPMITGGDGLEIERKGVDQVSVDVCCNFMLNSNHRDGYRKTRNDRRIAPLFAAQQQARDLVRDGMDGDYFPKLYKWLQTGGYAIVNELLHTWPIPPEFNPAGECARAPTTTSTEEAIEAGLGPIEQQIAECIEQGLPGFAGGWVSSMAVDALLERRGIANRMPLNKRREMLQAMGYEWHPALTGGRVNNVVLPDGGKTRLFVKAGHPSLTITSPAEVAKAYTSANTGAGVTT